MSDNSQIQKSVATFFVPEQYEHKETAASTFRKRPDLKLPDGRVLDDMRRSEMFKALTALKVPVVAEQGKNSLIFAYVEYLKCQEETDPCG